MKKIIDSKVVWVNAIVFVIAFFQLPEFTNVAPAAWLPYTLLAIAALNLILRIFFTANPLTRFAAKFRK